MSLTNGRDIYVGVHEDGLNKLIQYLVKLRPRQFNYGTPLFVNDPKLCCVPMAKGSLSLEDGLPLPGTNDLVKVEFAVQVVDVRVDVHPQTGALPPGIGLSPQRFSLSGTVVLSVAFPKLPDDWHPLSDEDSGPRFPYEKPVCCRFSIFAVCGIMREERTMPSDNRKAQYLFPIIESIEIIDIGPNELETVFERLSLLMIRHGVFNRTRIKFERVAAGFIEIVLSDISPNPSLANDQIKAWGDVLIHN